MRSERQLMNKQMDYNLRFLWRFGIDDPVWDHLLYAKNRDRLLEADIALTNVEESRSLPKI